MKWQNINKVLLSPLPKGCQEWLGKLRRYSLFGARGEGNSLVAMVDGRGFQGGLCDRWKGIVSLYAFAKATERDFRIYYSYPFDLHLFQLPNTYDWTISDSALSRRFSRVKLLRVVGENDFHRLDNIPSDKQIHCYANRDWVEQINSTFGTNYRWGELFSELFSPSTLLQNELQKFDTYTGNPYIAVALRVQNLFGDFPEYDYHPATPEMQAAIVKTLAKYVNSLHNKHNLPILVTSDSQTVLQTISRLCPFVFTNSGKAAHADTTADAPLAEYLKPMVDFYLLARAQKVFAPATEQMYMSDFPKYAAAVNNHDFERVALHI